MPRKASGVEKVRTIRVTQPNGDIYVIERKTKYDPIKKYNVTIDEHLIGKIVKGTMEIVPTRPKRKKLDAAAASQVSASKKHVGMLDIVSHVADKSGINAEVTLATGEDNGTKQKIQTLVWYCFATDGDTWPGVFNWTVHYAGLLPYRATPISQDMYHKLFVYLGTNESIKQSIFMSRAKALGNEDLIAFDSTTIATESENLGCGRKSLHKDGLIKNVYKVVTFYSVTSRQPIAYARIPGNIPDVQTVPNALKQLQALELNNVEIVSDNGYCSEENLMLMIRQGFKFITRIQANLSWISPLIQQNREELEFGGEVMHCDPKFSGISVAVEHTFYYQRQKGSAKKGLSKVDLEEFKKKLHVFIYYSTFP